MTALAMPLNSSIVQQTLVEGTTGEVCQRLPYSCFEPSQWRDIIFGNLMDFYLYNKSLFNVNSSLD